MRDESRFSLAFLYLGSFACSSCFACQIMKVVGMLLYLYHLNLCKSRLALQTDCLTNVSLLTPLSFFVSSSDQLIVRTLYGLCYLFRDTDSIFNAELKNCGND